ncbi:TonB-dependent receptor [Rufibacter ruber]|uniref:TonB-dependent receptor n=1 Tax=Rufibacter ruber TaxID=1783499 RepID=UPI0008348564|nr:TonB-dependent receptor [Rufibacter ruber]
MLKCCFLFFLAYLLSDPAWAQLNVVKGQVTDSTGAGVEAATISLVSARDTLTALSNSKGHFLFRNVKSREFSLHVYTLEYEAVHQTLSLQEGQTVLDLPAIKLQVKNHVLQEVVIRRPPPVLVKTDTVEFDVAQFETDPNATVDEVVKKLPGLEVDADGRLTTEGQEITELRMNGKVFTGADLQTALSLLPAELIQKIQVVDDYGEMARLSGVKTGTARKVLNLQVDPEKNKFFSSNGSAGMASTGRFNASFNANYMNNDRQLTVLGALQNSGGEGAGSSTSRTGGLNFREEVGKKLQVSGGFNYSDHQNHNLGETVRQSFYERQVVVQTNLNAYESESKTLSSNLSLEYRPNDRNFLRISPNFSFNSSQTSSESKYRIQQDSLPKGQEELVLEQLPEKEKGNILSGSTSSAPTVGVDMTWSHRFEKKGRTFTVNASYNGSSNEDEQVNQTALQLFQKDQVKDSLQHRLLQNQTRNRGWGASAFYVEPLSEHSSLAVNWSYSHARNRNNRETREILDGKEPFIVDSLTNLYTSLAITQQIGLFFNSKFKKGTYVVGINAAPTMLENHTEGVQTATNRRRSLNGSGSLQVNYPVSESAAFNLNYQANAQQPSVEQLQPIPDVTDPKYIIIGNPNLQPSIQHGLNLNYRHSDRTSNSFWAVNFSGSFTQNKIVQNTLLLEEEGSLRQQTRYLNSNGDYNLAGGYSYSRPFAERKYTLSLNGRVQFGNNVSYSNNQENRRQNWGWSQGLQMRVAPVKWTEVNTRVNYSYQKDSYQLTQGVGSSVSSWRLSLDGRAYLWDRAVTLSTNVNKSFDQGYARSFRTNPLIINAALTGRFLKKKTASVSLQAFDLLNENNNVSRTANGNTIIDNRTKRISRYYQLTLQMKLLTFAKGGKQEKK